MLDLITCLGFIIGSAAFLVSNFIWLGRLLRWWL